MPASYCTDATFPLGLALSCQGRRDICPAGRSGVNAPAPVKAGTKAGGDGDSGRRRLFPAGLLEKLRKAVDAYNGANQHTKDLYIERIQREPQMARAVGQLLHERELVLQRDRGMSR